MERFVGDISCSRYQQGSSVSCRYLPHMVSCPRSKAFLVCFCESLSFRLGTGTLVKLIPVTRKSGQLVIFFSKL